MVLSALVLLYSAHSKTVWDPKNAAPPFSYGASPAEQTVGNDQIFTESATLSDGDTFVDHDDSNHETIFYHDQVTITAEITSGARLGTPNVSYNNNTTTVVFTIQAPDLADKGAQVVKTDTFTFADNGPSLIKDLSKTSTTTVIWHWVAPAPGGGGS
jgi:hypothetical protein